MDKSFKPVKSVFNSNHEAIKGIMELYGIDQFDLDCTYSQGTFWKGIKGPKIKSDITPLHDDVLEANSENLPFEIAVSFDFRSCFLIADNLSVNIIPSRWSYSC